MRKVLGYSMVRQGSEEKCFSSRGLDKDLEFEFLAITGDYFNSSPIAQCVDLSLPPGIQGTVTDTCFPFLGMNESVWSTDSLTLQAFQFWGYNCAILSSK